MPRGCFHFSNCSLPCLILSQSLLALCVFCLPEFGRNRAPRTSAPGHWLQAPTPSASDSHFSSQLPRPSACVRERRKSLWTKTLGGEQEVGTVTEKHFSRQIPLTRYNCHHYTLFPLSFIALKLNETQALTSTIITIPFACCTRISVFISLAIFRFFHWLTGLPIFLALFLLLPLLFPLPPSSFSSTSSPTSLFLYSNIVLHVRQVAHSFKYQLFSEQCLNFTVGRQTMYLPSAKPLFQIGFFTN